MVIHTTLLQLSVPLKLFPFASARMKPTAVFSILCLFVCAVTGTDFNSTQYYLQSSMGAASSSHIPNSGSVSAAVGTGMNTVPTLNSGKFRNSFYPGILRTTTTPSPAVGSSPVWVLWNRQGVATDRIQHNGHDHSHDVYQYAPGEKSYKRHSSSSISYYDDYPTSSSNNILASFETDQPSESGLTSFFDLDEYEDEDVDHVTSAQLKGVKRTRRTGLEGLGGILSLKGLKLSLIGGFYLFRGLIILAWKFLPWLFLFFVGLLFLPIPIITIPAAAGRTATDTVALNMTDLTSTLSSFMQKLAESEQCVERISCDMRRRNRSAWFNPALKSLIYTYQSKLAEPYQRMAKAYLQQTKCRKYTCSFLGDPKYR